MRPTRIEINLNNLKENIRSLQKIHGARDFFCPMIKDNAYGHGDIEVATALSQENIKRVGVALVEEGIRLRKSGIKIPILVFGFMNLETLKECSEHDLIPVISSQESLDLLSKDKKNKIHLKFDTGMARLGFSRGEARGVLEQILANKSIEVEGICTHFLNSEDSTDTSGITARQMKLFSEIEKTFEGKFRYSHCMNSGALVSEFQGTEDYHKNKNFLGARPGISIYGYAPNVFDIRADLKPVMSLHSSIIQIRNILKNETVSYGGIWKAQRDSIVGTVCMGYGDGYPRNFSNNASVLFRGQRIPVIGRVCMDYILVDLTDFKNEATLKVGEEITAWGYQGRNILSAEDLAKNTNTISLEILTRVSNRIPRSYVG